MKIIKIKKNKAFALLYTSLLASFLLTLSVSIGFLVRKQIILSSITRESQRAFYMADSAAECALYWDYKGNVFDKNTATSSPNIKCQGVNISNSELTGTRSDGVLGLGGAPITRFKIDKPSAKRCAIVTVQKRDTVPKTVIEAEGYNTSCNSVSRIRLQRAVRLQY